MEKIKMDIQLFADIVRNKRDGKLKIIDGSTAAVTTEILFAEGDFTYNEPEANEPIPIKSRDGALDHLKAADKFNGWGSCSFAFKYVDKTNKDILCSPATTSADAGDKIPDDYPVVNVHYEIYEDDTLKETIKLYNVYFDSGKVTFSEGDEASTMNAEGIIFGKVDDGERVFAETETDT
jgi:hypothetical protein